MPPFTSSISSKEAEFFLDRDGEAGSLQLLQPLANGGSQAEIPHKYLGVEESRSYCTISYQTPTRVLLKGDAYHDPTRSGTRNSQCHPLNTNTNTNHFPVSFSIAKKKECAKRACLTYHAIGREQPLATVLLLSSQE